MAVYLEELQVVGAKVEATQNTAATLSATDYFLAEATDPEVIPEMLPRNYQRQSLDEIAKVLGHCWVKLKIKTELKGSGTAGSAYAPLSALLQSCGMTETVVASGGIKSTAVTAGGSGYTSSPTVIFTPVSGGSGAAAIALISGGAVVAIIITNPGSGYASGAGATISFSGGGGSGATATATSGAAILYVPTSNPGSNMFTPGKSVTLESYKGATTNAIKHQIKGAVAESFKISNGAAKITMAEFDMIGLYTAISNANTPSTTYNTTLPAVWASGTFAGMGFNHIISKFEYDMGIKTTHRTDPGSAYGVKGFLKTGHDPKGSFDPEVDLIASHDAIATLLANTVSPMGIICGASAGNTIQIGFPAAQYVGHKYGNRNGIITHELGLQFNQSAGDDHISILFT